MMPTGRSDPATEDAVPEDPTAEDDLPDTTGPTTGDATGVDPQDGTATGVIRAAGAVLWRRAADGRLEVAVVHRPHHRDWSLPKGKVDPGETRATTAVRELAEETGFAAALGRHLATVRYPVGDRRKTVDYWDARAGAGTFSPNGETDELRWLPPAEAAALVSYESDRDVLEEFAAAPFPLRTLLLVRHAKAGKRSEWSGPDDERPLEPQGREQAARLAELAVLHGVTQVHAVPRTRCEQTLEPLARRLGADLVPEPLLGDEAVARDPAAARRRLREIAAGPAVAAVCAQGDGIPELVRGLAAEAPEPARSNRRLTDPPSRKGSAWVLSFHGGGGVGGDPGHADPDGLVLVSADYVRDTAS